MRSAPSRWARTMPRSRKARATASASPPPAESPARIVGPAAVPRRRSGHEVLMRVAPGVLRRERVVRDHHPGIQGAREPGGVPHVERVDGPGEATTVQVEDGTPGGRATAGDHVCPEGADLGLRDREPAVEQRHDPGRQRRSCVACRASMRAFSASTVSISLTSRIRGMRLARTWCSADGMDPTVGPARSGGSVEATRQGSAQALRVRIRRRPSEPAPVSTGEGSHP